MAYQDPYTNYGQQYGHAGQNGGFEHQNQPPNYGYGQQQYGYGDAPPEFNPYAPSEQAHPTYEPGAYDHYGGGYRDDPPQRQGTQHDYSDASPAVAPKSLDERSSFDHGEFPSSRGPKTASNLRQYRMDFQGPLWTRGGRGSCIGRFFCCTFMIVVFLVATILLTLVLFLRPPSITFGSVTPMSSAVQLTTNGVNINMGVNISVENPNFFNVNLKKINAQIYYPINNTLVGSGNANNVVFGSDAETNFTFPFAINYQTSLDPSGKILLDIAEKCGILSPTKSDLQVQYKITLGVQILFVTVSPSISNTFTFPCPLSSSDLKGLLPASTGSRREEVPDL